MTNLSKALAAVMAAMFSMAAHAALWNFSYTFTNSGTFEDGSRPRVVGSFTGDEDGPYIRNLSNVQAVFYGSIFQGETLLENAFVLSSDIERFEPIASRNIRFNNFAFTQFPGYGGAGFVIYNDDRWDRNVELWLPPITTPDTFGERGRQNNWKLTRADIPEPTTPMLLLAGLGLLGFIARRRETIPHPE